MISIATTILIININRMMIKDVEEEIMMRIIDPEFILKVTMRS